MAADLHPIIARQLRRLGITPDQAPDAATFGRLLERVSQAYTEFDRERYLLDRSQNIASSEMTALNTALKASEASLSSLLSLSSDWIWEQDTQGRFTFVSEDLELRTGLERSALLGHACRLRAPCARTLMCSPAIRQWWSAVSVLILSRLKWTRQPDIVTTCGSRGSRSSTA